MVSTPAIVKKKNLEKKRKRSQSGSDSTAKKPKSGSSTKQQDTLSDDDSDTPIIPVYILIPKKTTIKVKSRKAADSADNHLQKGPFELAENDTYTQFLQKISLELPCHVENIHQSKIEWKPKKPLTSKFLTLGKETGYKAMMREILAKKADARTIFILMPAPAEPMEDDVVRHPCSLLCSWLMDRNIALAHDNGSCTGSQIRL
jgi:hypothetical protein